MSEYFVFLIVISLVSSISTIYCLEKFISEMTDYMSTWTFQAYMWMDKFDAVKMLSNMTALNGHVLILLFNLITVNKLPIIPCTSSINMLENCM